MAAKERRGPRRAFKRGGLAEVWRWAKAHGIKGWLRAQHWAHWRLVRATPKGRAKFKAAQEAYNKRHDWLVKHPPKPAPATGNFTRFDGHDVPHWIVADALAPARASGVWKGAVISGFRTPEECEALCRAICGQVKCPGRCAGRDSLHACPPDAKGTPYEGATDVTDPLGLRAWCAAHGYPLRGGGMYLPSDVNHFSRTGH